MTHFLKQHYGPSEGPLGFPLLDKQAQVLETLLKTLPKTQEYAYRKAVVPKAPTELLPGERADVSWISTENPDRCREVVLARGLNDSQFQHNPIVTLNHAYGCPPVGRSLWRKFAKDGALRGIKAKTQYPSKPDSWPDNDWPPDVAFSLVQADLLRGKSIGFLPTKTHIPDTKERQKYGWDQVELVIDEWLLLEYACCFLPVNPDAVVEQVSKSALPIPDPFWQAAGIDPARVQKRARPAQLPERIAHTPLAEVEKALQRSLAAVNLHELTQHAIQNALNRVRGRV
jgi:hypothetical protein